MAISGVHYQIMREIQQLFPRGGSLLQIGEANWYGDLDPHGLFPCPNTDSLFDIARAFYADLMSPSKNVAIDANGSREALRLDLNQPISLDEQFDVVINHGTAEHIFDIAQVFRTMHDYCEAGGLMIHDIPFNGWIDHGFYCVQPTLFYDLAFTNNYEVTRVYMTDIRAPDVTRIEARQHIARLLQAGQIPANAMLVVVLRKILDQPFRIPAQGYYAGKLDEAEREAWRVAR